MFAFFHVSGNFAFRGDSSKMIVRDTGIVKRCINIVTSPVSFGLNDFIIEGISLMSKEFVQALLLHEKVSALLIGLQIEAKKLN